MKKKLLPPGADCHDVPSTRFFWYLFRTTGIIHSVVTSIFLFSLLVSFEVLSQGQINSDYYSNQIPKLPETGSLGTFGKTPVNLYTGLPEIALPLMTLPGRKIEVPVTLNYDATGIRTDELSGSVGMKWSLNSGGFIVRQVNSLPDEDFAEGFLKLAGPTDYFKIGAPEDWASSSEKNSRDTAPDEFVVMINGRSIRFFFDKNKIATAIPRQDVRIVPVFSSQNLAAQRISGFDVFLEDGVKYSFGVAPEAIIERKVETMVIYNSYETRQLAECPKYYLGGSDPLEGTSFDCQNTFAATYTNISHDVKSTAYNYKWLLKSIVTPEGEVTTFRYSRLADIVYNTRPSTVRIAPAVFFNSLYTHNYDVCYQRILGVCVSSSKFTENYYNHPVIYKLPKTDPGSAVYYKTLSNDFTIIPPYFNPVDNPPNAGGMNTYHTLFTEGNSKLLDIVSATGNKITFTTSAREDLPNGFKYETISLINAENKLVKSLRLNYTVQQSRTDGEYFWFGEALIMSDVKSLKEAKGNYFATDVLKYTASEIPDANLRKFVFEGMKDHNYKRTFLKSIDDITNSSIVNSFYDLAYQTPEKLRRRTTALHGVRGYVTTLGSFSLYEFQKGRTASCTVGGQSTTEEATVGMLTSIRYPTNGSTAFTFSQLSGEPKLTRIADLDQDGTLLYEKEFEYDLSTYYKSHQVSYQEYKIPGKEEWMKYVINSSSPQNDSYNNLQGVQAVSQFTKVIHGKRDDNNGFEIYQFSTHNNYIYADLISVILSNGKEDVNIDGRPLQNIFPFPKNHERDYYRGLLLSHSIYKKGTSLTKPVNPVKTIVNTWEFNPDGYKPVVIRGFKGGSFVYTSKNSTSFWYGHQQEAQRYYRYSWYGITNDWVTLKSKKEITIDKNDPTRSISLITEFIYDPNSLLQAEVFTYVENSNAVKKRTKIKYSSHPDYAYRRTDCDSRYTTCTTYCANNEQGSPCYIRCDRERQNCESDRGGPESLAIAKFISTDRKGVPIELQEWFVENGTAKLVSSKYFKYIISGSIGEPVLSEVWESGRITTPAYTETKIGSLGELIKDSRMRKVHSYDSYDPVTFNVIRQTSLNGLVNSYAWETAGSYVKTAIVNPGTYEHKQTFAVSPLIGITRKTDENGVDNYYRYDRKSRLSHVLDHDGNILKRLRYHLTLEEEAEAMNASIKCLGVKMVGSSLLFESPAETREYGSITYEWNLGNGTIRTQVDVPSLSFTYSAPGTYTVTLKKSHPEYGTATGSVTIAILPVLTAVLCVDGAYMIDIPPSYLSPARGDCTVQNTTLTSTLLKVTAAGGCGSFTYRWEFLGANGLWVLMGSTTNTSAPPSGFTERLLGSYKIRCTVTDGCGNTIVSNIKDLAII